MPLPVSQNNNIRKSAKELVYDSLRDWIIDGTLVPGEKLVDSSIAAYFNVSRTPVREAILALANQKLVDVLPGKFTIVSYFDMKSIYSLYTAVSFLHGDALTAAFPKIDTEIIDRLTSINQRYLDTRGAMTFHDIYSIDMEFHRVFFETADNMYMDKFKEELDIHALRIENRFFKSGANRQKSYEGHQRIIECLTTKDLQGAVEAMKENFMYTVREIADSGSHLPVQGAGERAAAQVNGFVN